MQELCVTPLWYLILRVSIELIFIALFIYIILMMRKGAK